MVRPSFKRRLCKESLVGTRISPVPVLAVATLLSIASSAFAAVPSVQHGYDLYQTLAASTFSGVPLIGVPLGTFTFAGPGVANVGNTDTIITRASTAIPGAVPGSATISIQLLALQMETITPADFGLGTNFYFVTLQSARGGPASSGTETINFASTAGGTFSSSIDVFYDIRLGGLNGPIAISGDAIFSETSDTWGRTPPAGATTITGINLDLNTFNNGGDFFATPDVTAAAPGSSQFVFGPAGVPEPASLSLLGFAGIALLLRRRR
jgi:hypothetical protein